MTAWSVDIFAGPIPGITQAEVSRRMIALDPHGAAIASGPNDFEVGLEIEAPTVGQALDRAVDLVRAQFPEARITSYEVKTVEELERKLEELPIAP